MEGEALGHVVAKAWLCVTDMRIRVCGLAAPTVLGTLDGHSWPTQAWAKGHSLPRAWVLGQWLQAPWD